MSPMWCIWALALASSRCLCCRCCFFVYIHFYCVCFSFKPISKHTNLFRAFDSCLLLPLFEKLHLINRMHDIFLMFKMQKIWSTMISMTRHILDVCAKSFKSNVTEEEEKQLWKRKSGDFIFHNLDISTFCLWVFWYFFQGITWQIELKAISTVFCFLFLDQNESYLYWYNTGIVMAVHQSASIDDSS